jgi:2-keto-4-pentenoate hydratase/2-oxohepta-3-ene-1,7-dioic acid hydratase in catechol pathway
MKLLTYRTKEGLKLGIKDEHGILDVAAAAEQTGLQVPLTMDDVLQQGNHSLIGLQQLLDHVKQGSAQAKGEQGTQAAAASRSAEADLSSHQHKLWLQEERLDLAPCVPNPKKIFCIGLNYAKHAAETNTPLPQFPVVFNKFHNTLSGHGDSVPLPINSEKVDYEAELVIVIGQRVKGVSVQEALNVVFGYCNGNDLSARDLQKRTQQWLMGKCPDGFCPIGPYVVTADEVGDPQSLAISSYVNRERRQHSSTADMIFSCAELISELSQSMTLEPGDLILTGTPEGVIMGYPPAQQIWLKHDDEVTIEIEKLGRLSNHLHSPKGGFLLDE